MLHIDVAVDIRDVGRVLGRRFLVHRGYDVMLSLRDEDAMFRTRPAMSPNLYYRLRQQCLVGRGNQ
jgi:hypothetical protein